MDKQYIGISENRLHHILSVSRECYQIAKSMGKDEDFCRKMFMIGWIHDVGYEFSTNQFEHPNISSEMLHQLICYHSVYDNDVPLKTNYAICYHGKPIENESDEWIILNKADLTIDSKGNKVSVVQRLNDIKDRYGEKSKQYLIACDIAIQIGLIDENFIKKIEN